MNRPETPGKIRPDEPDGAGRGVRPALSPVQVRTVFSGILLAMFLGALNQTIVATALPTIGRDFEDFANLSWVVTAYLLTSTVAAPLYGKLSDIHGRRSMMLAAIGLFIAGSTLAAVAPDMLTLVIGRALQGAGGGGVMPLAQIIIADIILARERGRYQAQIGVVWIGAGVLGPVVGGYLSEHTHWSLIFWINVPLGLMAAFMTSSALKLLPRHERRHRLDLVGAGLLVAGAIALLLALNWGGTRYPWVSAPIAALVAASGVLSLLFAWRLTATAEPFLPIPVLADKVVRMGTMASSCAVGTPLGLTVFLPLYYEVVHGLTASDAGFALIPIAVMSTPGSIAASRAMMRVLHYKRVPIIGLSLALVALAALIVWPVPPLWVVVAMLSAVTMGCGSAYPICTVSVQNAVPRHQVGTATGVMNFFRALTSALIVAVMGAIVLAGFGATFERGRGTEMLAASARATGADFSHVFRWLFVAAFAFLALGLYALVVMEERPLPGPVGRSRKS